MAKLNPTVLTDLGIVSSLGLGKNQTWQNLFAQPDSLLSRSDDFLVEQSVVVGAVTAELPDISGWPKVYQTRCNQMALAALMEIKASVDKAVAKYGADRVGVIVGTSTSGTQETEKAFLHREACGHFDQNYHYEMQEMGAVAKFIAKAAGLKGMAFSISTACSSGAKAMVSAANMVKSGLLDAVICGGADSLCELTIHGFHALESLSFDICNPFSANRTGINIGEGAALFLLERGNSGVCLAGYGESSDAHHMSAPHPQGEGALSAMRQALLMAQLTPQTLDYINLHGTATPKNDEMEAFAIVQLGAKDVPASSTKALTGHTLAGAGAIEAGICYLVMSELNINQRLPPHRYDGQYDEQIAPITLVDDNHCAPVRACLSNSFAFGGSNVSLVITRCDE